MASQAHGGRRPTRVLLTEASSLTAREHITVLGLRGYHVEVLSASSLPLGRWSRWVRAVHRCPPSGSDPVGYLDAVEAAMRVGGFDALLATHEQGPLLASSAHLASAEVPVALASSDGFGRVTGKTDFAQLAAELGLPQPDWTVTDGYSQPFPYPYFLKSSFGTAGMGVRLVSDETGRARAARDLSDSGPLLAQRPAPGNYAQVQALFDHGRVVAVLATALGAAGEKVRRRAVAAEVASAILGIGTYRDSDEGLTPLRRDPISVIPLAVVLGSLLIRPAMAHTFTASAVASYAVGPTS